jgi:hypothetical protein
MQAMIFLHLHIDLLQWLFLYGVKLGNLASGDAPATASYTRCSLAGMRQAQHPACCCKDTRLSQGILALSYFRPRIRLSLRQNVSVPLAGYELLQRSIIS